MRLRVDVTMDYQLTGADSVLLTIEAARTEGQIVHESRLEVEDARLHRIEGDDILGNRVWACVAHDQLRLRYHALADVTRPDVRLDLLGATAFDALPGALLPYVRPSRFCQSDLFTSFVDHEFGRLEGGAKIAAMRDWVAAGMSYVLGSSNSATTAIDTFVAREGVCRDYTHLLCGLARAANIPARYASVYGARVAPADFHAVAQVWLDGAWHIVDPTGMGDAAGLVVIAAGRDAGDVAIMETEKGAQPISQTILVTQVDPD